jgi:hypothetical protein
MTPDRVGAQFVPEKRGNDAKGFLALEWAGACQLRNLIVAPHFQIFPHCEQDLGRGELFLGVFAHGFGVIVP